MNETRKGKGRAERGVLERVIIKGTLRLEKPAHFGNGDIVGFTDMPLLRDSVAGKPLLTGASIAGALRNYLWQYQNGYGVSEKYEAAKKSLAEALFGCIDDSNPEDKATRQSWLFVEDALGEAPALDHDEANPQQCPGVELRDGVAIDAKTHTAEDQKKFGVELLEAGWIFKLQFELLLNETNKQLLPALGLALRGLQNKEIGLGYRKRRGFGECSVSNWEINHYHLTEPKELVAWLEKAGCNHKGSADKVETLLAGELDFSDKRETFTIDATFKLESSLLIRSGTGGANAPDAVHLRSRRGNEYKPILSGTSLAGAIRNRAYRILKTIKPEKIEAGKTNLIDEMFGQRIEGADDVPTGSRLLVRETEIDGTTDLVQTRVKIDGFTGGAFPTALFSEQPVFGGEGARVKIHLTLQNPQDEEIGLLLLVLKDLWTSDLPLGGESSVGRGRLVGDCANMTLRRAEKTEQWEMKQVADGIEVTGGKTHGDLETYVEKLWTI
ncbi:MAG: RAMP superfamily CRISPR-associated protein [candidate division KSB1 bacterium]